MARLISVYPIADENTKALPVKALDLAVAFYQRVLGFSTTSRSAEAAALMRDDVQVGLVVHRAHDPGRAGSLALEVDDLEDLHDELTRAGGRPGEFGVDEWDGRAHRTFFLREEENGYCYCFYQPVG